MCDSPVVPHGLMHIAPVIEVVIPKDWLDCLCGLQGRDAWWLGSWAMGTYMQDQPCIGSLKRQKLSLPISLYGRH